VSITEVQGGGGYSASILRSAGSKTRRVDINILAGGQYQQLLLRIPVPAIAPLCMLKEHACLARGCLNYSSQSCPWSVFTCALAPRFTDSTPGRMSE
jgi:hypothetical protein